MIEISAGELAALLGGELIGHPAQRIDRIATLQSAGPTAVSFLANPKYRSLLDASAAGCVIVAPDQRERVQQRPSAIVCADPYAAYARLTRWWAARLRPASVPGVHASAVLAHGAKVAPTASVGPLCVLGEGAEVGEGAVIGPQCHLGAGANVGAGTRLAARVALGDGCRIGARGIVHPGAVIGADGFGFAPVQGHWEKIEQLGAVRIGDDVEIGANSCIDRGALDDTVLEDGVKLDNLVQVGHNVHIGAHSALAGCVGIAGSARIGRHCTFGGGAIVPGLTRSIGEPGHYSGVFPFDDNAAWEKNAATLRQLHSMRTRLRTLERALERAMEDKNS